MTNLFCYFEIQRFFKDFGKSRYDSIVEPVFNKIKEEYYYFSPGLKGVAQPYYASIIPDGDFLTSPKFKIAMLRIDGEDIVDFNNYCLFKKENIEPGIKRIDIDIEVVPYSAFEIGPDLNVVEKIQKFPLKFSYSSLIYIHEGNNFIYTRFTSHAHYIRCRYRMITSVDQEVVYYNGYQHPINCELYCSKVSSAFFKKILDERNLRPKDYTLPLEDFCGNLFKWNINEKNLIIENKPVNNVLVKNVEKNVKHTKNEKIKSNVIVKTPATNTKKIKFYETEDFIRCMEPYDYMVKDEKVILLKVKKPSAEMMIPNYVNYINDEAFSSYLNKLYPKINKIVIPSSVSKIGKNLFNANAYIETIILDANIDSIPEGTFNLTVYLENLVLPKNLKYIDKNAFTGTAIKRVNLSSNVIINDEAFDEEILYIDNHKIEFKKDNDNYVKEDNEKSLKVPYSANSIYSDNSPERIQNLIKENKELERQINEAKIWGNEYSLVIYKKEIDDLDQKIELLKNKINELKQKINDIKEKNNCFNEDDGTIKSGLIIKDNIIIGVEEDVKEIYIPNTVEQINININYTNIKTVVFEKNSSLKMINDINLFKNLEFLVLPDNHKTFKGLGRSLKKLKYIYIPSNYAEGSFEYLQNVQYLHFERNKFAESKQLPSFSFYFLKNSKLKGVIFPYKMDQISDGAFSDCCSLEFVIPPTHFNRICWNSFKGCVKLKDIFFISEDKLVTNKGVIDTRAFDYTNKEHKIYYESIYYKDGLYSSKFILIKDDDKSNFIHKRSEQIKELEMKIHKFRGKYINDIFEMEER